MPAVTRTFVVNVGLVPTKILSYNSQRSSYNILNQHAALAIWVKSGQSGVHIATVGDQVGERVGPNGGAIYDNQDLSEVWAISTAVNNLIVISETVDSGVSQRTGVARR